MSFDFCFTYSGHIKHVLQGPKILNKPGVYATRFINNNHNVAAVIVKGDNWGLKLGFKTSLKFLIFILHFCRSSLFSNATVEQTNGDH